MIIYFYSLFLSFIAYKKVNVI